MSYDIDLLDPYTRDVIILDEKHQMKGGTFVDGGTRHASFNITWNYGDHFRKILGDQGIRIIYGMTGAESIPVLEKAISQLGDDVDVDYWKPTEGNAKKALYCLIKLARIRPDGLWNGD